MRPHRRSAADLNNIGDRRSVGSGLAGGVQASYRTLLCGSSNRPRPSVAKLVQRAGRFTQPQGRSALTMSANPAVQDELLRYKAALEKAA